MRLPVGPLEAMEEEHRGLTSEHTRHFSLLCASRMRPRAHFQRLKGRIRPLAQPTGGPVRKGIRDASARFIGRPLADVLPRHAAPMRLTATRSVPPDRKCLTGLTGRSHRLAAPERACLFTVGHRLHVPSCFGGSHTTADRKCALQCPRFRFQGMSLATTWPPAWRAARSSASDVTVAVSMVLGSLTSSAGIGDAPFLTYSLRASTRQLLNSALRTKPAGVAPAFSAMAVTHAV